MPKTKCCDACNGKGEVPRRETFAQGKWMSCPTCNGRRAILDTSDRRNGEGAEHLPEDSEEPSSEASSNCD